MNEGKKERKKESRPILAILAILSLALWDVAYEILHRKPVPSRSSLRWALGGDGVCLLLWLASPSSNHP